MPDVYTQRKLVTQQQFVVGSLADYRGKKKALCGTVKVIKHERKGGVYIEADGVRALVSPFALTPVAAVRPPGRGKRPDVPAQNGNTPTARVFRNGVPVEFPKPTVATDALARLRQIGQPPTTPPVTGPPPVAQATPPPLSAPLGKAHVDRFFVGWLKNFRRNTVHRMRQAGIDGFDLAVYLDNHVPELPGLHHYRMCVYYITSVGLADPSRLPPPDAIPPLVSARFGVDEAAVAIHLTWMRARLAADHAAFAAKLRDPAPVGVTP